MADGSLVGGGDIEAAILWAGDNAEALPGPLPEDPWQNPNSCYTVRDYTDQISGYSEPQCP